MSCCSSNSLCIGSSDCRYSSGCSTNCSTGCGCSSGCSNNCSTGCGCACGCSNNCSSGCGCSSCCNSSSGCSSGCGCSSSDCSCNACAVHPSCPYPQWKHPLCCCQTHYCCAGNENGPTLVIHKIVLEPCGNQSCTPRTFNIRITGPSYPNGEVFSLRAGSCLELDEPLVISGLTPGTYTIEELFSTPNEYVSTITGPVCGRCVTITNSCAPTVVTIVNRKRLCRLCAGSGCGCSCCR